MGIGRKLLSARENGATNPAGAKFGLNVDPTLLICRHSLRGGRPDSNRRPPGPQAPERGSAKVSKVAYFQGFCASRHGAAPRSICSGTQRYEGNVALLAEKWQNPRLRRRARCVERQRRHPGSPCRRARSSTFSMPRTSRITSPRFFAVSRAPGVSCHRGRGAAPQSQQRRCLVAKSDSRRSSSASSSARSAASEIGWRIAADEGAPFAGG